MLKRAIDIAASAAGLLLLSPLLAMIAAAILLESGRPVCFVQERVGRGFRRFRVFKFRTMRDGMPGAPITAAGDPRITRLGRLLRRTKLDELPQLWNVLRGDMSLVGPRPELPEYVERFRDRYRTVLTARPGVTDLASVRFRNEEELLAQARDPLREYANNILPAKLDLAEEYVRQQSLKLDLTILLKTLWAVLRGR